tara:strand:- start:148 stop:354 length:207 start_codon:yes stop_codon:yes gene_type:complete
MVKDAAFCFACHHDCFEQLAAQPQGGKAKGKKRAARTGQLEQVKHHVLSNASKQRGACSLWLNCGNVA